MKRNTTKLSMPQLPDELQREKEQLILSPESTAAEKLTVIEHYLPRTRNLVENLSTLRHLELDDSKISSILSGSCHYIYGEVVSQKHPSVKVVCAGVIVSIEKVGRDYMVCLDKKPVESYIRAERERQESMTKEADERSKEELVKEIRSLRREIKRIGNEVKMLQDRNETLTSLYTYYEEKCKI